MKKVFFIFLAFALCACAKPPATTAPESGDLAARWNGMATAPAIDGPYLMRLSFRFGKEGDTRRVTAMLWGNGEESLRLDVSAGVGATVMKIAEDGDHFLLFSSQDNKAYIHDGPNRPQLKIGVPLPFTLIQLADLLNGHYTNVFGDKYASASMDGDDAAYALEGIASGELLINAEGLPVEWRQTGNGWILAIAYGEDSLPKGIKFTSDNGKMAVLLVKDRERPAEPFTSDKMSLELPPDTPTLPLADYKSS